MINDQQPKITLKEIIITAGIALVFFFFSLYFTEDPYNNSAYMMFGLLPFAFICSNYLRFDGESGKPPKTSAIDTIVIVYLIITAIAGTVAFEADSQYGYNEVFVYSLLCFSCLWCTLGGIPMLFFKKEQIRKNILQFYGTFLIFWPVSWIGGLFLIAMIEGD
ncbi:hypothetical protein KAJ27_25230 [bacterium]|nr:hypothetical protein [bacterium]